MNFNVKNYFQQKKYIHAFMLTPYVFKSLQNWKEKKNSQHATTTVLHSIELLHSIQS